MNKKKKSIQYQWHPILLRIYNCQHFQWLLAQRHAPFCRSPSCYTVPTLYVSSSEINDHPEVELRLIAYPLLVVSLWPSQDKPPKDVILIKQQLTDDEVETFIISELMRLICFHSEPDESVCESVRLLLNSAISETVRRSYFGKKKLFDYHRTSASFNNRAGIAGVSMQSFNNCVTMPSKSYLRLNL